MVAAPDITARERPKGLLRVEVFRERYGEDALKLAYHGAFPLTLTTDLLYCLRENFVPDAPWYTVGDVLLSGLCRPVGHDLYEMEADTRRALLDVLKADLGDQAEARVLNLEQFMLEYVHIRLATERRYITRMIGDELAFRWTALAPFRPEQELVAKIQRDLATLAATEDAEERFWLARLVKSQADWLTTAGYQVLQLWADNINKTGTLALNVETAAATLDIGLPVKTLEFEVVTLRPASDEGELQPFEFKVVTVNERGEELTRATQTAYKFLEPLGNTAPPLEMVAIPSGEFIMGAPEDEKGSWPEERPQHTVAIEPFFMGRTPITQAQWRFVATELSQISQELADNPSKFKGDNLPVEQVSWEDAMEFCARLSIYTQREYRLPTESEWEYACRADTTTPFHFGATSTSAVANYDGSRTYQQEPAGEDRRATTPIDHFGVANQFGLSDTHGNVWEWCLDHWQKDYERAPTDGRAWLTVTDKGQRVLRGGSCFSNPRSCRSANRFINMHDSRGSYGVRVVCVAL
jgi:formylglycine-generating enzyme required for sulfatase activity